MREILGGQGWMLERCSVPGWRWRGLTLCLMKHPKTSPQGSFWAHPGGGMGGERIARCLICPLYPRGRERASAPVLCVTASSSQPAFPSELQDKLRD